MNAVPRRRKAIVLVTHYQRILNYIKPDYVHVLIDGRIVRSGGSGLAQELEAQGYEWLREPAEDSGVSRGDRPAIVGPRYDANSGSDSTATFGTSTRCASSGRTSRLWLLTCAAQGSITSSAWAGPIDEKRDETWKYTDVRPVARTEFR